MTRNRLLIVCLLVLAAVPATADTFILPHMLEPSGSLSLDPTLPGAPDTVIRAFDTGALHPAWVPGSNWLQVSIYAEDGSLFTGTDGTAVCGPCVFDLDNAGIAKFSLVEVMVAAGISSLQGGGGYVEIETMGAAPDDVALTAASQVTGQNFIVDHSLLSMRVPCGGGSGGQSTGKRTAVATGLTENSGSPMDLARCADASLYLACGVDAAADVDLYLFDQDTGAPLREDGGNVVCNPCSFPMGGDVAPRKRKLSLETLMQSFGGNVPAGGVEAMAVAEITGDADAVSLTAAVLQSRSGPGDLSVFVFEPNTIAVPPATSARDIAQRHAKLRNHPDPFNPQTTLSFTLDRPEAAELKIVDLQGRVVRTLNTGRLPAGAHEVRWDGRDDGGAPLPSGVYLARLQTSTYATVEKLALLK